VTREVRAKAAAKGVAVGLLQLAALQQQSVAAAAPAGLASIGHNQMRQGWVAQGVQVGSSVAEALVGRVRAQTAAVLGHQAWVERLVRNEVQLLQVLLAGVWGPHGLHIMQCLCCLFVESV
jgi:hypothetical protein